jgi:O-antigen/teichoic acid export membrane protein
VFETLDHSLKKVARGTGIAIVGIASGLLFNFVAKLIIARYGLEANYGMFSLALAILTVAMMLACLGLHLGATRYIAYFRARGDIAKVRGTISFPLQVVTIASLAIGIALFFSAEAIAINIFHTPQLAQFIKIFAIGTPFFALIYIMAAIFRGFDQVEPQVYFQYIALNVIFIIFLALIVAIGLPFVSVFYAYLAALVITFIGATVYTVKKLPQPITFGGSKADAAIRKELLLFSLPLLATAIFGMSILWLDTIMLGYFKTADVVGLYNAAYPLAQSLSSPPFALMLIYIPIVTGLYSQNLMADLRRSYIIATKWIAFITMPIFLVLCLYPEYVLNLLFGPTYMAAAPALRLLSIGFIIDTLPGPTLATLIALGESRFIMWTTLAAAAANVILNIALIPPLGIVGAAIASAASLTLFSVTKSVKLYTSYRVQPLSKNLLKPLVASVILALIFQLMFGRLILVSWWVLPLLFILYYVIYGTATVLSKSFDREDIVVLLEIEKRFGINAEPIKKILRLFI